MHSIYRFDSQHVTDLGKNSLPESHLPGKGFQPLTSENLALYSALQKQLVDEYIASRQQKLKPLECIYEDRVLDSPPPSAKCHASPFHLIKRDKINNDTDSKKNEISTLQHDESNYEKLLPKSHPWYVTALEITSIAAPIVGMVTSIMSMTFGAQGVEKAESDLEQAKDDANYDTQGIDSANAAVQAQIDKDRNDYINLSLIDNIPPDEKEQQMAEIASHYESTADGTPDWGMLSESGKASMQPIKEDAYEQGVESAKILAVSIARHSLEQAKETESILRTVGISSSALGVVSYGGAIVSYKACKMHSSKQASSSVNPSDPQ